MRAKWIIIGTTPDGVQHFLGASTWESLTQQCRAIDWLTKPRIIMANGPSRRRYG
jgi:hypothetical protein